MFKFVAFLPLFIAFSSFSQDRATRDRLERDRKICEAFAETSIQELKDGVLLVRLNFRQKQIDYLMDRDTSEARKVREKALSTNKKITTAFKDLYDFSTVYFFQSTDSKHVRNQSFDSITFYDYDLNPVNVPNLDLDNYLIGEFGRIKQDTAHYYSGDRIHTQHSKDKTKVYYGGSKNGREAFIIMDRKFQQIQKPFPYFSSLQPFMAEKGRYRKSLDALNGQLKRYYAKLGLEEEQAPESKPESND